MGSLLPNSTLMSQSTFSGNHYFILGDLPELSISPLPRILKYILNKSWRLLLIRENWVCLTLIMTNENTSNHNMTNSSCLCHVARNLLNSKLKVPHLVPIAILWDGYYYHHTSYTKKLWWREDTFLNITQLIDTKAGFWTCALKTQESFSRRKICLRFLFGKCFL